MSHVHRGKFYIMSNKNFAIVSQLPYRPSADRDVHMLRDVFSRLGFDVVVHCDRTAVEMHAVITDSMCVCCLYCGM